MTDYFGVVRTEQGGDMHLTRGAAHSTLCGRRRGKQWAAMMRGIVTAAAARDMPGVCRACLDRL